MTLPREFQVARGERKKLSTMESRWGMRDHRRRTVPSWRSSLKGSIQEGGEGGT
jgi:hypothetical protein